jgi:subtilase family serine protease
MSISFGACESAAGPSGVAFWDTLFKQAAAEGISVLVSSGDSGASGCDASFATPPTAPAANSPNYICSSSYVTCVGGTQFNDTTNPSQYWSATNDGPLHSASGYIPEGGWNEPLNANNAPQVAASGGGVSRVIATPSWQTGTGVPSARTGRYTPDVAFSASQHDGYFGCFAAAGASCVAGTDGSFSFVAFSGTSAAAPAMAAIAAFINTGVGAAQGNLGPQLYQLAATTPTVFHDVTVASSGVTSCSVNTPSMCNNSSPGPTSQTGGQAGYLVTTGYDEVTGLGSIDILNLLENYPAPPTLLTNPTSLTLYSVVGFPTLATVRIKNNGSAELDSVTSTITGANASDFVDANNCPSTFAAMASCSL